MLSNKKLFDDHFILNNDYYIEIVDLVCILLENTKLKFIKPEAAFIIFLIFVIIKNNYKNLILIIYIYIFDE